MKLLSLAIYLLVTSFCFAEVPNEAKEMRTWTSTKGTTIWGQLVSMNGQSVTLRTDQGREINVLKNQLSAKDLHHLNLTALQSKPLLVAYDRHLGSSGIYSGGARRYLEILGKMHHIELTTYKDPGHGLDDEIGKITQHFEQHPGSKHVMVMCAPVNLLNSRKELANDKKNFLSRIKKWEAYAKTHHVELLMIHPSGTNPPELYKKEPDDSKPVIVPPSKEDKKVRRFIEGLDQWKIVPVYEVREACLQLDPMWQTAWSGGHHPRFMT
ncbi:hypothetical protein JIN77_10270 [Verrucomicrobiaceae bacterium R5-34]|nr:hypothetical protein [Verrucomicrobiaceae bacterium R5-34]